MTAQLTTLWDDLAQVGRDRASGGYRRFAWTDEDVTLREWFAAAATDRGLDVTLDRAGNQWAWWGDPDAAVRAGRPGLVVGSHLDSVPDGGAFDGPLGVVSALVAVERLRDSGFTPARPIGVACFGDEEGARFGVACAGSRLLTGAMTADQALALRDGDGITMAEAMRAAGVEPEQVGADPVARQRIGTFVELHVEQGRSLADGSAAVGVASSIWAHGRWRFEFDGTANHAGTTRLADRDDPMLAYARAVLEARTAAERHEALATFGKVLVVPNGVNAIPSRVNAWLDGRADAAAPVEAVLADLTPLASRVVRESWTDSTRFDPALSAELSTLLADRDGTPAPVLGTGAGHDAGILAQAGVRAGMLFVRNPTGISHSPAEYAEPDDCAAGVDALVRVVRELAS